jgi:hypothetical protein
MNAEQKLADRWGRIEAPARPEVTPEQRAEIDRAGGISGTTLAVIVFGSIIAAILLYAVQSGTVIFVR